MIEITSLDRPALPCPYRIVPTAPSSTTQSSRPALRVGVVQHRWHPDAAALRAELDEGIGTGRPAGGHRRLPARAHAVPLPGGHAPRKWRRPGRGHAPAALGHRRGPAHRPHFAFAADAARQHGVYVHASLYQRRRIRTATTAWASTPPSSSRPEGELLARTHKPTSPSRPATTRTSSSAQGPAVTTPTRSTPPPNSAVPAGDAHLLGRVVPRGRPAIFPGRGGDPGLPHRHRLGADHPDFDTQPLWQQVIVGNGIANGLFMVVPNRCGGEGADTFYGSSFISDPYGRVLVQAPRDEAAVLVADLDLDQRRDWLDLFPFLATRRPDTYAALTARRRCRAPARGCDRPTRRDRAAG